MTLAKHLALVCAVACLSACGIHSSAPVPRRATVDSAAIVADQTLAPAPKAEALALAGEQLTTPTGFMYADLVFDQALALDPSNVRAQFYKAFLKTPLALRGILSRLKPLAEAHPDARARMEQAAANLPEGGLKTFLFDGPEDLRSERDAQAFGDEIYEAQNQFRLFLRDHKDLDLTLNLNDWVGFGRVQDAARTCAITQTEPGVFDLSTCNLAQTLRLKLNRADAEALQQITAGVQIYLTMYLAYDASGTLGVARRHDGERTARAVIWRELSQNPNFGKLRHGHALENVLSMGIDAVAGARWAARIQNELCPRGEGREDNRPGFLFARGMCIAERNEDGSTLEDTLKLVDLALAGQIVQINPGPDQIDSFEIRPAAVLRTPIVDLKALVPKFNPCDKTDASADPTLGGLFPRGDLNQMLAAGADCEATP